MTEQAFRVQRRQKFLTEQYYALNLIDLDKMQDANLRGIENLRARGRLEPAGQEGVFEKCLSRLKLHYTAGAPLEQLSPLYLAAVGALRELTLAQRAYVQQLAKDSGDDLRNDSAPLFLEDLYRYQQAMEMISLGVLLGQGKAIRQIAGMFERYRGSDLLFDALIEPAGLDKRDNTDFFHLKPYDPLIDAFYTAETPEEAVGFMTTYLENWYKSFEGLPGHNGHLKATDEYMPYYGYWSFEAAAICVIYGIDDTSFREHLVYPKDLADWARAHHSLNKLKFEAGDGTQVSSERLRCEAGQPCPREGEWETPAQANSRRRFKQGDVMPSVEGDYGQTIWQWVND